MAKRKLITKQKKDKKPSGESKKLLFTKEERDALIKEHREGERRIIEKLRRDSCVDPKYLRIPFNFTNKK